MENFSFQSHFCTVERLAGHDIYTFTSAEKCPDYSLFDPFDFLVRSFILSQARSGSTVLIGSMNLSVRDEVHDLYLQQTGRKGVFSRLTFSDGFRFSGEDWQGLLLDKLPEMSGDMLSQLISDTMICVIVGGNGPDAIIECLRDLGDDATSSAIIVRLMIGCESLIFPGHDGLDLKIYARRRFWSSDLG
jgi:hypothetical protein